MFHSLTLSLACVCGSVAVTAQGLAELRAENEHLKKQIGQYDQVIRKANGDKQKLQRDLERYEHILCISIYNYMCAPGIIIYTIVHGFWPGTETFQLRQKVGTHIIAINIVVEVLKLAFQGCHIYTFT